MEKHGIKKKKNYYKGNILFEGKHLNGKRNVKEKAYNYNGKLGF